MTAQIADDFLLEGSPARLHTIPALPTRHARIVEVPGGGAGDDDEAVLQSTACWRGYIGSWELREGRLYLCSLRGGRRLIGAGTLFAAWCSQTLRATVPAAGVEEGREGECEVELALRAGVLQEMRETDESSRHRREEEQIFRQLEALEDLDDDFY